jgi:UDP-2-acetamido-3-amino-2,3-dideoxy-glucuronate N-acetyltransferase
LSEAFSPMPSLRVTVAGCGRSGGDIARAFHEIGALAALCDADSDMAAAACPDVACRPFEEVLTDPTIAAIAIASPGPVRAQRARDALMAGKHVFVDGLPTLDMAEAEELRRLAERAGRTLMVSHLFHHHPGFLKLKALVDEGAIGRLQHIAMSHLGLGGMHRDESVLWSFAPQDVSMLLALTGEAPERIEAVGIPILHKTNTDTATLHLSFPGGAAARIVVSRLHPVEERKLVVVGDRAMAVFDDGQPWPAKLQFFPHRIDWISGVPTPVRAEPAPIAIDRTEPLPMACRHFLDCAATGQRPRTDGAGSMRVLAALRAAERSMDEPRSAPPPGVAEPARFEDVMIHESACVDHPVEIGPGSRIWHFTHILGHVRIGRDCNIGQNVMIGPKVTIGDRCKIQNNVSVYPGVTLEDGVFCGPSCVFTNVINPRAEIERKHEFRATLVRRGATIGANATIVCGVTLGQYSFVAAGAVVSRDVPPHALVAGVPARRIGWMSHAGQRLGSDLTCPQESRRYRETSTGELEEMTAS